MMKLTSSNYHGTDANKEFWSVSLFKAFDKCEASGLAQVRGQYEREMTDSLLFGSYVDAYFTDDKEVFMRQYGDLLYTRKGDLYAKFAHANECIDAIETQPLMVEFLKGDRQVIMTANLFDVPGRIKMDVFNGERIVDHKCVKDFEPMYKDGSGRVSWIEYWGYDIQGAIYQKVVEKNTGKKLPFYIVAVTKEKIGRAHV